MEKLAKQDHLTKERELELGVLIQARSKALQLLENPRLTEARQEELHCEVAAGDLAIKELVHANLGLVYSQARKFKAGYPGAPDLEDLIQEGMAGLMVAVYKYDPSRGNKFSTVACWWIRQSISRGVNKTGRLVRLPENRISDYGKMNALTSRYEEENLSGSELDEKIQGELGLSPTEIFNIRNAANWHTSLNKPVGSSADAGTRELIDVIGELNPVTGPDQAVATSDCYSILHEALGSLAPVQQEIVAAQFSLQLNGKYHVATEVREAHQLTTSRYRRLFQEGLAALRDSLAERDLKLTDFLEA